MKFGTLHQILNPVTVTWPKIEISEIQDDGGRHLENRFFGHHSSTDCRILSKFCMRKQNGMLTRATGQKMQMCKIQDGGRPPFWKSLNLQISVKMSDFTEIWYIIYWTRLQSTIEFFKIQDGGDRHLENRFFGHNSLTDCPMSAKVCMRKQHGMPTNATWQKLQIFKIQDGGRPPF